MRKITFLLVVVVLGGAAAYVAAGLQAPPVITLSKPGDFAGAAIPVTATIQTPGGAQAETQIFFEQNGVRTPVAPAAPLTEVDTVISAQKTPGLTIAAGPAKVVVRASRRVWGLRTLTTETVKNTTIRLEKPRVSVLSTKHYVNLGGSEMIVYRATPSDAVSGVRVGDIEYRGYPAAGVSLSAGANGNGSSGVAAALAQPDVYVAFFALRYDQDVNAPMVLFARDVAGEEATAPFDHLTFPKPFKKSTIPLDDRFLDRVVPAILAGTKDINPQGSTIEKFVAINSELRKINNARIASFAAQSAPEMFWGGQPFHAFANTKAEAAFADFRTYVYNGKEVDKQVHLGFDLASFANTPVVAANRGKVLLAEELGIYGNCVIVDHGMGVQSLYGHLSSFSVKAGDMVDKGQELGKSGMTGLAGGDHLHFTMIVSGQMVNPIEWWDPHWIQDRIVRKLQ